MVYFKIVSLFLIQYTLAAPAKQASWFGNAPSDATDDILDSLGIELTATSQRAAEKCFQYSMTGFDCITEQSLALPARELTAFLAESKQAAVDAATTGLKSISEQRPIMMKLQAKCQGDIKRATSLIDKVVRSYAEEQIILVTNAIKDLGSVDLSTFDFSKLWG